MVPSRFGDESISAGGNCNGLIVWLGSSAVRVPRTVSERPWVRVPVGPRSFSLPVTIRRASKYLEVEFNASIISACNHQKEKSWNLFHSKIKVNRLQEEHNIYPWEYQQFVCITFYLILKI